MIEKTLKWEAFTKDTTESALYIACLKPKTQQEATRFIYGKNPRELNQKPIIDCRKKYLDYAFETKMHGKSIHDFKIISRADPFLEYIQKALLKRAESSRKKNYDMFSQNDIDVVRNIFDSEWFRNFFDDNIIRAKHYENIHDFISLDEDTGKLKVYGSLQCIGAMLETIATISWAMSAHPKINRLMPYKQVNAFY